jgi:hypothetical protein
MTSSTTAAFRTLLLLVFCPSCPGINVGVGLLKELLIRYTGTLLLLLAERVVQVQEDATTQPELHL